MTKKRQLWPIQDIQCRFGSGVMSKAIIHLLFIHAKHGYDTTVHPYGMSKVMNNLILGECADTFIDVNCTWKDVFEAGGLIMILLTYGNDIDDKRIQNKYPKENVLVYADTFIEPVGQLSNAPSGLTMAWLGVELPCTRQEWFPQTRWEILCQFHWISCFPRCPAKITRL